MPPAPIQKWWVIQRTSGARGGPPQTMFIASQNKPVGEVAGPFNSQAAAVKAWDAKTSQGNTGLGFNVPNPAKIVQGWFGGLGGMIGSGIEGGFIQSVKDIWDVIIGPLEVVVGFIIAAFVLVVYFKDDIIAGIKMLGQAAGVAAMVAA